jgi:hypothetical protein
MRGPLGCPARGAVRDVLGGPFADSGHGAELRDRRVEVPGRLQIDTAVPHRAGERRDRRRPGARQADARGIEIEERFGAREETTRRSFAIRTRGGHWQCVAVGLCEPPREGRGAAHAHLLSEDCAHGDLEAVPGARHAQPGPRIGAEVEQSAQALADADQRSRCVHVQSCHQVRLARSRGHVEDSGRAVEGEAPDVAFCAGELDARDRAQREEPGEGVPVQRRAERQAQLQRGRLAVGALRRARAAQDARRAAPGAAHRVVEAADAREPRRERDLRERQRRLVDELLREVQTPGLRDREGRSTEVLEEESPKLARTDAEPVRERVDPSGVHGAAVDESQRARHGRGGTSPRGCSGRRLRATAQARPEARLPGCRRAGQEQAVLALRRPRRADGAAVDTRRADAREEVPVEARVAGPEGAIADIGIELHVRCIARPTGRTGHFRTW